MTTLDLDQIQSNVLRGYRHDEALPTVRYDFLEFQAQDDARKLVARLLPRVTSCAAWNGGAEFTLNLAFSHRGITKLESGREDGPSLLRSGALGGAFEMGMKDRASEVLGDRQESDPSHWDDPFTNPVTLDAVVSISSADAAGLAAGVNVLDEALASAPRVKRVATETASALADQAPGTEHFGFVDGIGQPEVAGSELPHVPGEGTPTSDGWAAIAAGEFVLGYPNSLKQSPHADTLARNGSFMVFRKLHESVARFREYVADLAERRDLAPDLVAAKMVGRWRDGTPLVLSPSCPDQTIAKACALNDFRYDQDPDGHACPFGSHIRRANPRDDASGPGPRQVKMHRIIRRALPYGEWLPEGQPDDGKPRGVLFVVINANIENQFEYVQSNWMNDVISSDYTTYPEDRDPLTGDNAGKGKLLIPGKKPVIAWDLPRFVVTKGGEYFFLPSLAALEALARPAA